MGSAAGENEERSAHVGDLIDEGFAFDVGEFVGMAAGLGFSPAMATGEGAGAGDLPGDDEGLAIENRRAWGRAAEPMPREAGPVGFWGLSPGVAAFIGWPSFGEMEGHVSI